jgi:hypothetical protein
MPASPLPLISATDYPGFQRLIPELQQMSYEEWAQDHDKAVAYRRTRNGSQDIPISPAEFEMWLKQHQLSAHLELLWACVEDRAKQPTRAVS